MSPYAIFALGVAFGGPAWLALAALLTSAKRADEEADRAYEEELRRIRLGEKEAEDHGALVGFQGMARWE